MTMTRQGQLADEDLSRLLAARDAVAAAEAAYRRTVAEMVGKSSIRTVAAHTGLSTNTVRRWKDEASRG